MIIILSMDCTMFGYVCMCTSEYSSLPLKFTHTWQQRPHKEYVISHTQVITMPYKIMPNPLTPSHSTQQFTYLTHFIPFLHTHHHPQQHPSILFKWPSLSLLLLPSLLQLHNCNFLPSFTRATKRIKNLPT